MVNALRAAWTVNAGVVIGEPIAAHHRQWLLLSVDTDGRTEPEKARAFAERLDAALEYARGLSDPGRVNWVTLDFVWL